MVYICDKPYPNPSNYDIHFQYPYTLSDFQKYAIQAIVEGHHVLVTAHTGSGKTLPAEFSINHFVQMGKKVVYTSPIKALSNQKFSEFSRKYPHISFGLMTGDIKTNPDADVLIMTTEILMNALFLHNTKNDGDKKPKSLQFQLDIDTDLGCVVFDEVHYINDADRGQTWEKTIMMLPKHIQMVMLSATIDDPQRFAKWAERGDDTKQVYLASTDKRVVPLSHYGYLSVPEGTFKTIKDKTLEKEIRDATQTLIPLQNDKGMFNETGHKTLSKMLSLFEKRQIRVNRKYLLNNLALFLRDREMLPAIVFVFSRKHVEQFAAEITVPILEDDSKIPYIVRRECEQIVRKFTNYHEYLELPEYNTLVGLLEKGVGIHHSGMIPVLREIVEIMISKKYIKLLFATESFAIGLDCPIKTAVFSGLTKFDGSNERLLMGHEYTQMAGRAGRRGIDTVGYVVHCNNLFGLPTATEYRKMLAGKPQSLVSKFRISYSLILNLIKNEKSTREHFAQFVQNSMMNGELQQDIESQTRKIQELATQRDELEQQKDVLLTPYEICAQYIQAEERVKTAVNKRRKELEREMQTIKDNYKSWQIDVEFVQKWNAKMEEWEDNKNHLEYLLEYIKTQCDRVSNVLLNNGFVECDITVELITNKLTTLGQIAASIGEIHPLVLSEWIQKWNWFSEFDPVTIIGLCACFCDVKVAEEHRMSFPHTENTWLKHRIEELRTTYLYYEDCENEQHIHTGLDYVNALNYDMTDFVMEWCACSTEVECKGFIQNQVAEKGISIGDFCKAILKISTIVKELSMIAESMGEIECLHKFSQVDGLILKYITTAQSLYI